MSKTRIVVRFNNLPKIKDRHADKVTEFLMKLAADCEGRAKELMEGLKSGRVYGSHIASAPGEAPAVDTGELKNDIRHELVNPKSARTLTDTDHSAPLEFGSVRWANQPNNGARPYMLPAAEATAKNAQDYIDDVFGDL